MSYSLAREISTMEPDMMLLPTPTKIAKMMATGIEILEGKKEEMTQNLVQKFQGLINCLSVLCLTRIGNNATKTITAFADERNMKRLHKCFGAKRNLDKAVAELIDITRERPPVALSVVAPMGKELVTYTDAHRGDKDISIGGVVLEVSANGDLEVIDAWTAMTTAVGDWNIMELEALALWYMIQQEESAAFEGVKRGDRVKWGIDNQSDLYGISKGGLVGNLPLAATIAAILKKGLSIDWRWIASCRNLADYATRGKWRQYTGSCPVMLAVKRKMREVEWTKVDAEFKAEIKGIDVTEKFESDKDALIDLFKKALKNEI